MSSILIGGLSANQYDAYLNFASEEKENNDKLRHWAAYFHVRPSFLLLIINRLAYALLHHFSVPTNARLFHKFQSHIFKQEMTEQEKEAAKHILHQFEQCFGIDKDLLQRIEKQLLTPATDLKSSAHSNNEELLIQQDQERIQGKPFDCELTSHDNQEEWISNSENAIPFSDEQVEANPQTKLKEEAEQNFSPEVAGEQAAEAEDFFEDNAFDSMDSDIESQQTEEDPRVQEEFIALDECVEVTTETQPNPNSLTIVIWQPPKSSHSQPTQCLRIYKELSFTFPEFRLNDDSLSLIPMDLNQDLLSQPGPLAMVPYAPNQPGDMRNYMVKALTTTGQALTVTGRGVTYATLGIGCNFSAALGLGALSAASSATATAGLLTAGGFFTLGATGTIVTGKIMRAMWNKKPVSEALVEGLTAPAKMALALFSLLAAKQNKESTALALPAPTERTGPTITEVVDDVD